MQKNKSRLYHWLDINPVETQKAASVELIKAFVAQRVIKTDEELLETEKAVNATVRMHVAAMQMAQPGIGFIPSLIDMWKAEKRFPDFINYDTLETYKDFGGIRNEEDFVITTDGYKLIGKKKPKTIEDIENQKIEKGEYH